MTFEQAKLRFIDILLDESQKTGLPMSTLLFELMRAHNEFTSISESSPLTSENNLLKFSNRRMVEEAMRRNGFNQRKTARDLGIAKSTLCDWLKRWKEEKTLTLNAMA